MLLMRRKYRQHIGTLCRVNTLDDLEPSHLQELQEFHALGRNIVTRIQEYHTQSEIIMSNNPTIIAMKLGYHAIPSLEPLHLHILSTDLDSECIKKREHIISFTSSLFFVEAEAVERHLESAFVSSPMVLTVRKERAMSVRSNAPMMCTRCGRGAASVSDWKRHNRQCNITISHKTETQGRCLNSLLGWRRGDLSKEATSQAEQTTEKVVVGSKR